MPRRWVVTLDGCCGNFIPYDILKLCPQVLQEIIEHQHHDVYLLDWDCTYKFGFYFSNETVDLVPEIKRIADLIPVSKPWLQNFEF